MSANPLISEQVNGVKIKYRIGERRSGDVEQIWADPTKANKMLNWKCQYDVKDALKHSWAWEQTIEKA